MINIARTTSPILRRALHEQIVQHLGLSILQGELRTGEMLPSEADLGARFVVSRTVVRQAVKLLAAKGMVASRPKTGISVRPRAEWNLLDPDVLAWQHALGPSEEFLLNLCEVRLIIEPAAGRLAAVRATGEEVGALDALYRCLASAVDEREAYIAADMHLHNAIVAAAHNETLQQINKTIARALRESRLVTTQVPGSSAAVLPLHGDAVAAIRDRDCQRAEEAVRALVLWATADIKRVFHGANDHQRQGAGTR